jgi:hypothetical protein
VSLCYLSGGESANLFHLHSIFRSVLQSSLAIDEKLQPSPKAFQTIHGYLSLGIDHSDLGSTQIPQESNYRVQVRQWYERATLVDLDVGFAAEPVSIS